MTSVYNEYIGMQIIYLIGYSSLFTCDFHRTVNVDVYTKIKIVLNV